MTEAASDQPVLKLEQIQVTAGARTLVDVPALELGRGEILALVGPNGAGKSTLLLVAGLLKRPSHGTVTVGGRVVNKQNTAELRRSVAMVFQSPLLFDVSVLANAASGLRFHGVARRAAEERARRWLDRFAVAHLEKRGVRGLSAGEAQRVSLARAFATEPAIMLLDEPFAAVDAPSRASLLPEVADVLRTSGASAIFVTHHLAEARVLADRVAVLFDGRIAQTGTMDDLMREPATAEVDAFFRYSHLGTARS